MSSKIHSLRLFFDRLPRRYVVIGAVLVIVLCFVGYHYMSRDTAASAETTGNPVQVSVSSVAALAAQTTSLPVTGKVTSHSEATILSQTSGGITKVYKQLGDYVSAGSIIAEFENSSQRAAVTQAEGAYDAAEAALAKTSGSSATIGDINQSQAQLNLANTRVSAISALHSAYSSADDAVHVKADALFSNPRTSAPTFNLPTSDNQLAVTAQNKRVQVEAVLTRDAALIADLDDSSDIDASIQTLAADVQVIGSFLDTVIQAVNQSQPTPTISASTIAGYQSSLQTGRSNTTAAIASVASAKTAYDSAVSAAQVAAQQYGTGTNTSQSHDMAAAEANVKQALGSLQAAKAQLEKTIVRSPISGRIVSLPINTGDFVASFAQMAQVSDPGALEVTTYVTADDAKTISIGNKTLIDNATSGVITKIAPAIDPATNKIEVKVGIVGSQSALTDGETVSVSLDRTAAHVQSTSSVVAIPIVALKITPQGPVVFTLDENSMLVAHKVTIGSILGEQIAVLDGLTSDMQIVTDARGLSEGQLVTRSAQ